MVSLGSKGECKKCRLIDQAVGDDRGGLVEVIEPHAIDQAVGDDRGGLVEVIEPRAIG